MNATTVQYPERTMADASPRSLYEALPEDLRSGLSDDQKMRFQKMPAANPWKRHPVDIRFNLPVLGGFYLTVIAGRENRSPERRIDDRHNHPIRTIANTMFFIGVGGLLAVLSLFAMVVQSAIVEF